MSDILSGKIDVEEIDRKEKEREAKESALADIAEREKEAKANKGRPGKGHRGGYIDYCERCCIEYLIEMPKCFHCRKDTMT